MGIVYGFPFWEIGGGWSLVDPDVEDFEFRLQSSALSFLNP